MHYFVSSTPLPLSSPTHSTLETSSLLPPTASKSLRTIVFSHDFNPFDPNSNSFQSNTNNNITKPNFDNQLPFNGSPVSKYANVIPLARSMKDDSIRQGRVLTFRPLFVYRQQQAMKNRPKPNRYHDGYYPPQSHYYPSAPNPHYNPYNNYDDLYEPPYHSYNDYGDNNNLWYGPERPQFYEPGWK